MQTNQMKNTAHKRSNTVVLLVIAALLVLVMIFLPERNDHIRFQKCRQAKTHREQER